MEEIIRAIEEALKRKDMSAAAASMEAVGNPALIKNLKNRRATQQAHPLENLKALAEVLDLELYFGPPRDSGPMPPTVPGNEFANIPLHDAGLAAGLGIENGAEEVVEYLAFRRDWLRKIGVAPSNAVLARVVGDSMRPTIWPEDMVLIDTARTEIPVRKSPATRRRSPVYAILDAGVARVKRIERPSADQVILLSDNPDHGPEFSDAKTLTIIGKVMWWGHTSKE